MDDRPRGSRHPISVSGTRGRMSTPGPSSGLSIGWKRVGALLDEMAAEATLDRLTPRDSDSATGPLQMREWAELRNDQSKAAPTASTTSSSSSSRM